MVMDSFDVVVLGSLHLDIMVDAPSLPRLGETLAGTSWAFKCGGKGGNQAVEAARQGARTAMVARVGTDDFATRLLRHLTSSGIDTGAVRPDGTTGSGMSVAITQPEGDYAAVIVSGSNLLLDQADIAAAVARLGSNGILVLQNEIPAAVNAAAAGAAQARGCRVLLNAAPARPSDFAADILLVNAVEAEMLGGGAVTGLAAAAAAAGKLAGQGGTAIVTAGGDGLAVAGPQGAFTLAAHPVSVVSTHGAGDAFAGALAARLATGQSVEAACRFANAAAAVLVATPEHRRAALGPAAALALLEQG